MIFWPLIHVGRNSKFDHFYEEGTIVKIPSRDLPTFKKCGENEFTCFSGDRACIPAEFENDGDEDCSDGSDENGGRSKPIEGSGSASDFISINRYSCNIGGPCFARFQSAHFPV